MSKRVLSLFMALTLFVSLFGISASADGIEPETVAPVEEAAEDVSSELPLAEAASEEVFSVESIGEDELDAAKEYDEMVLGEVNDASEPDECDFTALISDRLYIAQDASAGLEGKVYVSFLPLTCIGTLYLPGSADTSKLFLSWNDEEITLSSHGTVYESGAAPIAPAGETAYYTVKRGYASLIISVKTVQGSPDVSGMFLELDEDLGTIDAMNGDPSHETSCYGTVTFDGDLYPYMSMKGRGNSTWDLDKKPYNLTFYKKSDYDKKKNVELIAGVEAKKWSLLANYLDTSLLRNKVGLDLASKLGIGLDARFVDLWMNGEYLGNYLLTPKNDYQAPDGGYALENDNYLSDDPQFDLPGMKEPASIDGFHNLITVKDIGDDAVDAGETPETVEAYFLDAWAALRDYNSEDYQNYFDIDSWAKQYLMYEVTKTYDVFSGSLLMHRDGLEESDKLIAGPAWDMDNSFGRTIIKLLSGVTMYNQLTAEGWYVDSVGYIADDSPVSLLQELSKHASFKQRISEIYNDYLWAFESILSDIDTQRALIAQSAKMDYERWGVVRLSVYYTPVPLVLGSGDYVLNYEPTLTWDSYVNNMRTYVIKRVQYLSDHLCAEYPAGEITGQTELQSGDTLELTAALTGGIGSNSFQWQSKVNKGEWHDIDGASEQVLKLTVTEADNGTKYRCIVKNYGERICMTRGNAAYAAAQTVLESVSISVKEHQHSYVPQVIEPTCTEDGYTKYVCRCGDSYNDDPVKATGHSYSEGFCSECGEKDPNAQYDTKKVSVSLSDGTLTLIMNKSELGEYTFKEVNGGWTIRNAEGRYIAADGKKLTVSDTPFVWSYSGGVFSANVRLSYTTLGMLLGIQHTGRVYLTASKGSLSISQISGTKASFQKTVEYLIA